MQVLSSKRVDVPAKEAWDLLADRFGEISEWAGSIEASRLKGGKTLKPGVTRVCTLAKPAKDQDTIHETVVDVNDDSFSYEIKDMPGPFLVARKAWMVTEEGDGCHVQVISTMIPDGFGAKLTAPILRRRVKKGNKALLADLATHLKGPEEAGKEKKAKPAKKDKAAKKAKKQKAKKERSAKKQKGPKKAKKEKASKKRSKPAKDGKKADGDGGAVKSFGKKSKKDQEEAPVKA